MSRPPRSDSTEPVDLAVDSTVLPGDLGIPDDATGIVVFAHGTGSSRKSPRNRHVAEYLREGGLATLLFDLLTEAEDVDPETRFDIDLLSERLAAAIEWVGERESTRDLAVGVFGSSTGAAAALIAAARKPGAVATVVSRGGRPDLAEGWLARVAAPTLLIVGGADTTVLEINREALEKIGVEKRLEVVAGAGHLFEGPGELEEVARLAREWFVDRLGAGSE